VSSTDTLSDSSPPVVRGSRRAVPGAAGVPYLLGRLAQGVIVVFGAATVSFLLVHLTGNPAQVLGGANLNQDQVKILSHQLGYDRPLVQQYFSYLGGVLHGDFGDSFRFGEPAIDSVMRALPDTLLLVACAIALACAVSVPVAVYSALRREHFSDKAMRWLIIIGQGLPDFWLSLLFILLFAVHLGWVPSLGYTGFSSLILPVVALALPLMATFVRLLRGNLLDIMASDFVVAMRAKGLSELDILLRHALRNALVPFLTVLGLQVGWLIGGTLIIENVFVWPGNGTLLLQAVQTRDLTIVQAIVVIVAVSWVVINLAVDLLIVAIDPRIRRNA
jgi:glutathione transport system permease protein